jgi:hypothetical protein
MARMNQNIDLEFKELRKIISDLLKPFHFSGGYYFDLDSESQNLFVEVVLLYLSKKGIFADHSEVNNIFYDIYFEEELKKRVIHLIDFGKENGKDLTVPEIIAMLSDENMIADPLKVERIKDEYQNDLLLSQEY